MREISLTIPSHVHNKVTAIKAVRSLCYMGLKEAKDFVETPGQHKLSIDSGVSEYNIAELCQILRNEGFLVGSPIHEVLRGLRELASEALSVGADELANEIMQLILAEKLRIGPE